MPNRYLRESILTSEPVNTLSMGAEVFYRRLMSVVDDFGRFEANHRLLRSKCYPLRVDDVSESDIAQWLKETESASLVILYAVDGKNYLELRKLGEPRAKCSKFPGPCAGANICAQTTTNAPPSITPSITKTITNTNTSARAAHSSADADTAAPKPDYPAGFVKFWGALPSPAKDRSSRKQAYAQWKTLRLEPRVDEIMAALEKWKTTKSWREGFAPGIHRWLNLRKFDELPIEHTQPKPRAAPVSDSQLRTRALLEARLKQ